MDQAEFHIIMKKLFKDIDETKLAKFEVYKKVLREHNAQYNLTRLDSDEKIYSEYFLDSLLPYQDVDFSVNSPMRILDIGAGSGIPGVLLKIIYDNIHLTIIESNAKKCNFLKILMAELKLKSVSIKNKRAEDIAKHEREKYDIVTSRAVTSLNKILELSVPYAVVDGLIIEPKSLKVYDELENIGNVVKKLDLELLGVEEYSNTTDHTHNVVIFKKLKPTNKKYPREWQVISKDPL